MNNPIIETDLAQILNKLDSKIDKLDEKLDSKIDKLDEKIDNLALISAELKGDIKALDTKTEQLNIRVGNVEFASRGILIGIAVVVLGGFAMFFWMTSKL